MSVQVRPVGWNNWSYRLTIDGVEWLFDTSYFHVQKCRQIFRHSGLKALNYLKKNSSGAQRTGRFINW